MWMWNMLSVHRMNVRWVIFYAEKRSFPVSLRHLIWIVRRKTRPLCAMKFLQNWFKKCPARYDSGNKIYHCAGINRTDFYTFKCKTGGTGSMWFFIDSWYKKQTYYWWNGSDFNESICAFAVWQWMQDASVKTVLDLNIFGILRHVHGSLRAGKAASRAWHNYVVPCTAEKTVPCAWNACRKKNHIKCIKLWFLSAWMTHI